MKRILALALASCLTFAGCVQSEPEIKDQVDDNPAVEGTTPDDTAKDDVTLVYWSQWNEAEAQGQVINNAADAYMEENEHITIDINWQGREIIKVLDAKLSAGEQIDIFDGATNTILPLALDYALDLTPMYDQVYDTTNGQAYKDVILNATVTTTKTYSEEGEINGVPYQPFVQCILYNKDHFAAAGITETPKTWDEFMAACEALKVAGYAPMTSDDAYMTSPPGMYLERVKGAEWVSELVTGVKADPKSTEPLASWDDPAVLQMAEAYADMAAKGYFHENLISNIFPAGQQDIANGDVSMYLNATWLVNEIMITTGPEFPWGQMHYPTVVGTEAPNAANYASSVFVINENTENAEEAFKFLVYLTTGEWDGTLAQNTYGVPSGLDSVWPVQLEDAKELFVTTEEWIPWAGGMDDNADLVPAIRSAFTELIGGQLTPEQFVERMVSAS